MSQFQANPEVSCSLVLLEIICASWVVSFTFVQGFASCSQPVLSMGHTIWGLGGCWRFLFFFLQAPGSLFQVSCSFPAFFTPWQVHIARKRFSFKCLISGQFVVAKGAKGTGWRKISTCK